MLEDGPYKEEKDLGKPGIISQVAKCVSRPAKLPSARDAEYTKRHELRKVQAAKEAEQKQKNKFQKQLARLPQSCEPGIAIGNIPVGSFGWMEPSSLLVDLDGSCHLNTRPALYPLDSRARCIYIEHRKDGFHVWLDKTNGPHTFNWGVSWRRQEIPDLGFIKVKKVHIDYIPETYYTYNRLKRLSLAST